MLFHLVHGLGVKNALVLTKSADSTTRLVELFEFFERSRASSTGSKAQKSYSACIPAILSRACARRSWTSSGNRRYTCASLTSTHLQGIQCWYTSLSPVCSDLISRGIGISHVSYVVSYDAPVDMQKYVHRVERITRVGRTGDA